MMMCHVAERVCLKTKCTCSFFGCRAEHRESMRWSSQLLLLLSHRS